MNRIRKSKVEKIISQLEDIKSQIDDLRDEERKQWERAASGSDEEDSLYDNVYSFEDAMSGIEEAVDYLNETIKEIE